MPDGEDREQRLAERVVKEAVGKGLESPMRDPIVEAVEESEGTPSMERKLAIAGGIFGGGAAIGYLLGHTVADDGTDELQDPGADEPGVVTIGETESSERDDEPDASSARSAPESADEDERTDAESGGSWLRRLLIAGIAIAGAVLLRRRLAEEEEWEPIDEFESVTDTDAFDELTEESSSDEETEDKTGESQHSNDESEADPDSGASEVTGDSDESKD